MSDFLADLRWRGQLHQVTSETALAAHLAEPGRVGYCGFDPTADSLTIGNLVPLMMLRRFQQAGHVPIALAGGATGLVGDPSGRDDERQLSSAEEVAARVERISPILEQVLDFTPGLSNRAVLVNNIDWWRGRSFLDVLRETGKYFSVNEMIRRDSVRTRLEGREQGISYTEFSYMLLQAFDYLHLHREHDCTIQMAGSDQFGNIVSGIDLIRRAHGGEVAEADGAEEAATDHAFAVTAPLLLGSDGKKIGKSAGASVWLSAHRTSPYAFHQYWVNVADADLSALLRIFTDLDETAVETLLSEHEAAPHERKGQRTLANAVTDMIHGPTEREAAERAAAALFSGSVSELGSRELAMVAGELPATDIPRDRLADGLGLVELLPETSLANSRREAREFLGSGAVAVNGTKVAADASIAASDVLDGGLVLLRRGKRKWHAIRITD